MAVPNDSQVAVEMGDVVVLNSGGPPMTIGPYKHEDPEGVLRCWWFGNGQDLHTGLFLPSTLDLLVGHPHPKGIA